MVRLGMVKGQNQLSYLRLILLLAFTTSASTKTIGKIHSLIPTRPGRSWDDTVRGIKEALLKSELIADVSFEN